MTRTSLTLETVYSSAQCVLSVVGSIGVILLFAGIPQLIYSPVASVGNLMTFLVGALLITTMVAGNSFLNYKYRRFERRAMERRSATSQDADPEDKPPSYDAIISSDGLPPEYFTILPEKPPRYEEIASEIYAHSTIAATPPTITTTTTAGSTDTLTITSDTSPPCAGGVSSSMSSSCNHEEVGGLPGAAQKETDTKKEGECPPEDRGNDIGGGEKKPSEDNKDDGKECITNLEAHESVHKEEITHNSDNMNTDENTCQRIKEGREEGTDDRIRTSATTSKIKDRSQCVVQVTSFRGVAQNQTHMEESES